MRLSSIDPAPFAAELDALVALAADPSVPGAGAPGAGLLARAAELLTAIREAPGVDLASEDADPGAADAEVGFGDGAPSWRVVRSESREGARVSAVLDGFPDEVALAASWTGGTDPEVSITAAGRTWSTLARLDAGDRLLGGDALFSGDGSRWREHAAEVRAEWEREHHGAAGRPCANCGWTNDPGVSACGLCGRAAATACADVSVSVDEGGPRLRSVLPDGAAIPTGRATFNLDSLVAELVAEAPNLLAEAATVVGGLARRPGAEPGPAHRPCPTCGTPRAGADARFCGQCGTPLGNDQGS